MKKSKFLFFFFPIVLCACHSNLYPESVSNSESFKFKIIPGKAKTPSSTMPAGFGPIKGPSTRSADISTFTKDLSRCRDNLLNQQVHFEFNF